MPIVRICANGHSLSVTWTMTSSNPNNSHITKSDSVTPLKCYILTSYAPCVPLVVKLKLNRWPHQIKWNNVLFNLWEVCYENLISLCSLKSIEVSLKFRKIVLIIPLSVAARRTHHVIKSHGSRDYKSYLQPNEGLLFLILIKGTISIMSALCRSNYRYTGHTRTPD